MRNKLKVSVTFLLIGLIVSGVIFGLLLAFKEQAKSDIREYVKEDILNNTGQSVYEVPSGDYLSITGEDAGLDDIDINILDSWIKIAKFHEGDGDEEYASLHLAGVIEIPDLDIEEPVWEENSSLAMRYGVIRMQGYAELEEDGNCVIVGHRSLVTSAHFWNLTDIGIDDKCIITTSDGISHEYRVNSTCYCSPYDLQDKLDEPDGLSKKITLVTCAREYGNCWRFLVTLVPA